MSSSNNNNNNNNRVSEAFVTCSNLKHPVSELEQAIINSSDPIAVQESQEITISPNLKGIWANKSENLNWKGPLPLEKYRLNQDPNPQVIVKKPSQKVVYKQDIQVRYLNPPQPEKPGDIVIRQLPNKQLAPAPPLIIRQQQKGRAKTPEPVVLREQPPQPPKAIGKKVITIPGKAIPPPTRKVVVERLPELPKKPQKIIIERWLPYKPQKKKIIYQKANQDTCVFEEPRNVILDWQAPEVEVSQDVKNLGVYNVDPNEYLNKYRTEVRNKDQLPQIAKTLRAPQGIVLATESKLNNEQDLPEIEGDLEALSLVDLDKNGLTDLKRYLKNKNFKSFSYTASQQTSSQQYTSSANNNVVVEDLFRSIDLDNNGLVNVDDVEKVLRGLNSTCAKRVSRKDLKNYIISLDFNRDGKLNFSEFKTAFENTAC